MNTTATLTAATTTTTHDGELREEMAALMAKIDHYAGTLRMWADQLEEVDPNHPETPRVVQEADYADKARDKAYAAWNALPAQATTYGREVDTFDAMCGAFLAVGAAARRVNTPDEGCTNW